MFHKNITAINFTLEHSRELDLVITASDDIEGQSIVNGANFGWIYDYDDNGDNDAIVVEYKKPVRIAVAEFTVNGVPESGTAYIGFDTDAVLNIALDDDLEQEGFTPEVNSAEVAVAIGEISFVTAEQYRALAAAQKPYYSDRMRLEADLYGTYSEDGNYVTVADAMCALRYSVGLN